MGFAYLIQHNFEHSILYIHFFQLAALYLDCNLCILSSGHFFFSIVLNSNYIASAARRPRVRTW